MRFAIIGGGRAAWTFAELGRRAGFEIAGISLRPESASPIAALLDAPRFDVPDLPDSRDAVLFAVPDDRIAEVYAGVGGSLRAGETLFHASGIVPSAIFERHETRFALHPLRSLPQPGDAVDLDGALFVFEGAPECAPLARGFVDAAHGRLASIAASEKARYHAAAVFASNYVAVLLETARDLMRSAGMESEADEPLAELARSAIDNWSGGGARFTGPIARGDFDVVDRHLDALENDPGHREIYRALALALCDAILRESPERSDLKALRERLRHTGVS